VAGVANSNSQAPKPGRAGAGERAVDCSYQMPGAPKNMPLINLVVVLIVVGVALYLINRFIPMASSIKSILNVVVVVGVCVWLLQAVGLWSNVTNFRITR
jgi:predicted membrane protein